MKKIICLQKYLLFCYVTNFLKFFYFLFNILQKTNKFFLLIGNEFSKIGSNVGTYFHH